MTTPELPYPTPYATAVIRGRYRYELLRRWGHDPMVEFVMLNPSTATAEDDDATIRRCIRFAKSWGYGALLVRNLYGLRATHPDALEGVRDPVGPGNRAYLANNIAHLTIAAWGAHPMARRWWTDYPELAAILRRRPLLRCLGTNLGGDPKHPLYLPSATIHQPYSPPPAPVVYL